jgi:hypothetical protein
MSALEEPVETPAPPLASTCSKPGRFIPAGAALYGILGNLGTEIDEDNDTLPGHVQGAPALRRQIEVAMRPLTVRDVVKMTA